jgi:hypothetical protein
VGKSDAAHRRLVRLVAKLRAGGDRRNVAIAVPTHKLADEQAQRIMDLPEARAAGLVVRVWRGRSADDPKAPGQTMCRDVPAVELARGVALDPQSTVCHRPMPDGSVAECRHFKVCGYQRQRMAKADIWLVAHQLPFATKPDTVGKLAALVVDEPFWQAGLPSPSDFPLDLLDRPDRVPDDPLATDRLMNLRRMALDVLREHNDGPALRKHFQDAGMTVLSAREACELELRRKIVPNLRPGMTVTARKAATESAAANRDMNRVAEFWRALQALLADGGPEKSGWIWHTNGVRSAACSITHRWSSSNAVR